MKLRFFDLIDILDKHNNGYHRSCRGRVTHKESGKKFFYTNYYIDRRNFEAIRKELEGFSNISFGESYAVQAQEIRSPIIQVFDNTLKHLGKYFTLTQSKA